MNISDKRTELTFKNVMNKKRTIKLEFYYIFNGLAMEPPPDYTLFQEVHYDKDGLETARFNFDGKTYSYYDNKQRLVREQSFNEERVIVKEYEYTPDGEIYHTHEASYTLAFVKCWPVLPNGNIDTSSDMFEEGGWVPIGDTIDLWISYGNDSKTPMTETVITHEDGRVTKKVKAGLDNIDDVPSPVPPDCTEEFDEDSEGNWIRSRLVKKDGSVAIEIVRVIEYW